jgi:hypothetical protein
MMFGKSSYIWKARYLRNYIITSIEIKKTRIYTYTSIYSFVAQCLVKDRENVMPATVRVCSVRRNRPGAKWQYRYLKKPSGTASRGIRCSSECTLTMLQVSRPADSGPFPGLVGVEIPKAVT